MPQHLRRILVTATLLAVPSALAGPRGRSPRDAATEVLFASDEAALEPHLLRSTREQLQLMDPELRGALLEVLRPLGVLQQREDVRVVRLRGNGPLARVTIEGEVLEVGLGPPDPRWLRDRERRDGPPKEGLLELQMTVSEPKGSTVYILPMLLGLRKEDGDWRLARVDHGVNPFHLDFLALAYWLEDPKLAERVHGSVATANARAVINDMRTVISAEHAYAAANAAFFDAPRCLGKLSDCLPDAPEGSQAYLSAALASLEPKNDYARSFHPGPAATADQLRHARVSASSVTAFAYAAVPVKPGVTGKVSFCGDSTGRICVQEDGSPPPVVDGRCEPCSPLE